MQTDNLTVAAHEPPVEAFDEVFDLLAHPYRRTVIDELEPGVSASVHELAVKIAERHDPPSLSNAEIALVHNHLPRLAEADVVRYEPSEQRCELDDAAAVRAVLGAAKERV